VSGFVPGLGFLEGGSNHGSSHREEQESDGDAEAGHNSEYKNGIGHE
jgi:hypothetical protein